MNEKITYSHSNIELLTPDECSAVRQLVENTGCATVGYIGEILLEDVARKEQYGAQSTQRTQRTNNI